MSKLTIKFKTNDKPFNSSMLKIGELMEVGLSHAYAEHIIIRVFGKFVSLNSPGITWDESAIIPGRKLLPGESVTLTQE